MADNSAEVQAGLAEFSVTPDDSGVDEKSYTYSYWRKPMRLSDGSPCVDAGYIVLAPAWPNEFKRAMKKGMVSLEDTYGTFYFPYDKRFKWRPSADPYWLLFARGGAKEFPLKQILEFGWDRKPPYEGAVFPQLQTFQAPDDVVCPICYRKMPRLENAEALLRQHVMVAHKEVSQSQQLADSLTKAQKNLQDAQLSGPLADIIGILAKGQQDLAASVAAQAARAQLQDDRMAQLLEMLVQRQAPAAAAPPPAPEDVPHVEPESITFTAPEPAEAVPSGKRK